MRVHIGPLPSEGVLAWITYARGVMADRTAPDADPAARLSPDVVAGFVSFLDDWEEVARSSETFLWETDVDPEQVEFLALALFKIAVSLDDQVGGTGRPPAADDFYQAFVTSFLDAMTAENEALAAYAEELRSSWPDLDA